MREREKSKLTLKGLWLGSSVTHSVITEPRKTVPLGICLCVVGEGSRAGEGEGGSALTCQSEMSGRHHLAPLYYTYPIFPPPLLVSSLDYQTSSRLFSFHSNGSQ